MLTDWYYVKHGQQAGPISEDVLRQLVGSGDVLMTDPVWREGMAGWTPAGQALGMFAKGGTRNALGLASFVVAIVSGLMVFGLVITAGVMEATTPGGVDEQAPATMILGLGIIGGALLALAGLCLAIGSFFIPHRDRLFGSLGLAFNGVIIVGIVGLMILGMAAG